LSIFSCFWKGTDLKKHLPFIIFFAIFLVIGLAVYRDYGVSWDEYQQMKIGELNAKYALKSDPELLSFKDRYYGPVFEAPLWILTRTLPNPAMILTRHLGIFFVFAFGVMALYILAYRLFSNPWWSLLTVTLLILSPRLFADSFYNSKDIPFLAFFTIAVLSLTFLLDVTWSEQRRGTKIRVAALSALACAVAIDVRLPGIVLIPLTGVLLILIAFRNPKRWKDVGIVLATYLLLAMGLVILFWPILWRNPIKELINGFETMSHFSWPSYVLYRGTFILAKILPQDYIPTWIFISTPLLQLGGFALGVLGLVMALGRYVKVGFSKTFRSYIDGLTPDSLAWLGIVGWLVLPLATVIILHSVVYDGWRQMYFIYPSFLLIAVFGMKMVYERLSGYKVAFKVLAGAILTAGLLEPLIFAIQYHPHENLYFNIFAGDPATLRHRFEQDYWGLSYKQGIDYILAHDSSRKIDLFVDDFPGEEYINYMLPQEQVPRLFLRSLKNSDYFVTVFRYHPEDYTIGEEYYSLSVRGVKIMAVYKLK
jgi:hypothetical protein